MKIKLTAAFVLAALLLTTPVSADHENAITLSASATAAKNKKADALYKKYAAKRYDATYKITDITGDGVHEMLIISLPEKLASASSRSLQIFIYSGGKIKAIGGSGAYGIDTVYIYRKTKALMWHWEARGIETYAFMRLSGGNYVQTVSRSRKVMIGGKWSKWSYANGYNYTKIAKSKYTAAAKALKKGTAIKWKVYG